MSRELLRTPGLTSCLTAPAAARVLVTSCPWVLRRLPHCGSVVQCYFPCEAPCLKCLWRCCEVPLPVSPAQTVLQVARARTRLGPRAPPSKHHMHSGPASCHTWCVLHIVGPLPVAVRHTACIPARCDVPATQGSQHGQQTCYRINATQADTSAVGPSQPGYCYPVSISYGKFP